MAKPPTTEQAAESLTLREAVLPPILCDWRARLNAKAKQEKRFRFNSLYGLICHPITLRAAWDKVRANEGSPGVDGVKHRTHRKGRGGSLPGRNRTILKAEELPLRSSAACLYPQS